MADTMDVSWTIHFSSLSPAKVHLMDNYIVLNRFPFNATALQQAHLQNQWEQASALSEPFGTDNQWRCSVRN